MSRLATSFVLGFHGCDRHVGERLVSGTLAFEPSDRDYDWLGGGVYFWEADPQRALEWAQWKAARGDYRGPFVVGAAIDLGNCLDLVSRRDLELLRSAFDDFAGQQRLAGLEPPRNRGTGNDPNEDRVLRFLDCAVVRHLHAIIASQPSGGQTVPAFDTVRGMFTEGGELYPGSGFRERSHVQIAVRNLACIKGVFIPR